MEVRELKNYGFLGSGQDNTLKIYDSRTLFPIEGSVNGTSKEIYLGPLIPSQVLPSWKSVPLFRGI